MSNDIKQIFIPPLTLQSTKPTKPTGQSDVPKKRLITNSKRWDFQRDDHTSEYQLGLLTELRMHMRDPQYTAATILPPRVIIVKQQIHSKWYGYRAQDFEKKLFRVDEFLSESDIVDLLIDSRLLCFYCGKEVQMLYETVRDLGQWSIERIDNTHGHNRGNVVIACLGCNLRRKTMYFERFRMTKQMTIVKY